MLTYRQRLSLSPRFPRHTVGAEFPHYPVFSALDPLSSMRLSITSLPALSLRPFLSLNLAAFAICAGSLMRGADVNQTATSFHRDIQPLLVNYCYDCHGDGSSKGKVAFDELTDAGLRAKPDLWLAVLKNVRSGLMPPDDGPRPTAEEVTRLADWIKFQALGLDPANPDPGRVTVRRLNRIEYHNTIHDLMGIDFNSEAEFPPDDTGHGFDNIGDALSISPLLLEKYLQSAEQIANTAVPKVSRVLAVRSATGRDFLRDDGTRAPDQMPVGKPAHVSHTYKVTDTEDYHIVAELQVKGSFDFDPDHCNLILTVDGTPRHEEEVIWTENKTIHIDLPTHLTAGDHVVAFEIQPLELIKTPKQAPFQPGAGALVPARRDVPKDAIIVVPPPSGDTPPKDAPVVTVAAASSGPGAAVVAAAVAVAPPASADVAVDPAVDPAVPASLKVAPVAARTAARLDLRIASVQISGPAAEKFWIAPENHSRFFPKGAAPAEPAARDAYAREVLRSFATRAFRRPVDDAKLDQLVGVARSVYRQPGRTFEEGFTKAAMVVLASPRFLFRVEPAPAGAPPKGSAPVDEYALASRLSYLLWSTMPDDELFRAAAAGELRNTQAAQVARMLKDPRAQAFVKNFTGQWLEARDVEFLPINPVAVLGLTNRRSNAPGVDFDGVMRRAMRTEVEMAFDYVMREDRSVLELIEANYTFLNEKLAAQYGITGVSGDNFRRVDLPADSPRGGILTDGAVLVVTSNPTRTSPVKRGLFVLENILGTPPPPPPPDIPALEEAQKALDGHEPTLRELLAAHRSSPLCSSCHSRMDPLGLAFENFNALGMWRDQDAKQPITPAGKLVTGEAFANVRELKHIITHERRLDYYRCLTEKLMTYALGRGLEYYDVPTVDQIVNQLDQEQGKFSVLLNGVIQAAAFQRQRNPAPGTVADAIGIIPAPGSVFSVADGPR